MRLLLLFLSIFITLSAAPKPLDKVSFYYMAKEAGKKVIFNQDVADTASIHAMIKLHDVSINSLIAKKQSFNLDDLISGKIDLYAGYISNEPFLLSQKGIPYNIFSPKEDGFDFYSGILIQKTAGHITHSAIEQFISEWVSINYTKSIDFKYFKEILFIFFIFVLAFLYRQRLLSNKNKELEKLQDELVLLNNSLESKIKEAVADLEKSQEMAKMGSWILDIVNNELRWSNQTYKIFEINAETIEGLYEKFIQRVHPEDRELLENTYYKSLEEKKDYKLEHRLLMNDGSIKYVRENSETLFSQEGVPLISYGTVQDITETKLIEKEIEKKDAYMFHQSRLAQMGEMLSMIAHQWRQPLNAISVAQISITVTLELEKYDLSDKKQREAFLNFLRDKIQRVGQYVQNLSETISDFSDFYKPNKASVIRTVDRSILKSYSIIKESIESNLIEVDLDLNSHHQIKILESEFMQVIINILANAKEQCTEKNIKHPRITIKSFDIDDETYIEISDNAGGIDEKIIEKIFDPYFSTKLEQNGTGLGLYMSKMIIKDYHSGDIYAKNSDGGAIFTIKLTKHEEILEK